MLTVVTGGDILHAIKKGITDLTFTRNRVNVNTKMTGYDLRFCMDNYYTVSEYANLTGKDPGNIRRLLIGGYIKGEKIGRQWVISKNDAALPADRRVRTGKYRGSRKIARLRRDNPPLIIMLNRMCSDLKDIYGSDLESIVLYGSFARGEETQESDVDIALILKDDRDERKHTAMISSVADYEVEQGRVLSVVPIRFDHYEQWKRVLPYYRNIAKEGIVLWKSK